MKPSLWVDGDLPKSPVFRGLAKLAELKKAYKTGTGEPTRLSEARQAEKERRESEFDFQVEVDWYGSEKTDLL